MGVADSNPSWGCLKRAPGGAVGIGAVWDGLPSLHDHYSHMQSTVPFRRW